MEHHVLLLMVLFLKAGEAAPHPESMKLPLIHRHNDHEPPPASIEHGSHLHLLRDALTIDETRLKEFQARLRFSTHTRTHTHSHNRHHGEEEEEGDLKAARMKSKRVKSLRSPVTAGASAGLGQYLVAFRVGTPAQTVLLIADTGSDLVWARCSLKSGDNDDDDDGSQLFQAYKSSTFSQIPCTASACSLVPELDANQTEGAGAPCTCQYDYVYGDLSDSSGVLVRETATLNVSARHSARLRKLAMGCGMRSGSSTASFRGSSGVLGLGRGAISFASQMGALVGNRFSYCFPDFFQQQQPGHVPPHSFLVLGEVRKEPKLWQYTPLLLNPFAQTFYYARVLSMSVDGVDLGIPKNTWEIDPETGNGGTIVDSGTTLTYFLEPAYHHILTAFKRAVAYPRVQLLTDMFDLCVNVSSSSAISPPTLPQLAIHLAGDATMSPPATNYFIDVAEGIKCLGLQSVSSPYGFSVLGNLLQQNYQVEYDRQSNRLGFAPMSCSSA